MEKKLIELGFKKKWLSDHSDYWLQKRIMNKYFYALHITVDLKYNSITVWCEEPKDFNLRNSQMFAAIHKKFSFKTLDEILRLFC